MDYFTTQRAAMVASQLRRRGITDDRVLSAMGAVPRERFVSADRQDEAYADRALPIGHGQTISQPYMVARTCELAAVQPGDRVLDVGSGSGYQTAVLAQLGAEVVGIERIEALAERAHRSLAAAGVENVDVLVGDGTAGYEARAPYDAIVVAAAGPRVPEALLEQLAEGGRLVIPVGSQQFQTLRVLRKRGGKVETRDVDGCVFVPLIGKGGFFDEPPAIELS